MRQNEVSPLFEEFIVAHSRAEGMNNITHSDINNQERINRRFH